MFKKVLVFVVLLSLLIGSVSASSINGDFLGNPIVKVKSNGIDLLVEDVPAIIYEGRTMVPIYMLRQLGSEVIWDGDTYSVDVIAPGSSYPNLNLLELAKVVKKYSVINVQYLAESEGFTVLSFDYDGLFTDPKFGENMYHILSWGALSDASIVQINDNQKGELWSTNKSINDYLDGVITEDEFFENHLFLSVVENEPIQPVQPAPSLGGGSGVIKSKIVGDFEGFDEGNIYELDNGQIWKQVDYTYEYRYKYRPEVLIYKEGSSYYIRVDGASKEAKVEQLK